MHVAVAGKCDGVGARHVVQADGVDGEAQAGGQRAEVDVAAPSVPVDGAAAEVVKAAAVRARPRLVRERVPDLAGRAADAQPGLVDVAVDDKGAVLRRPVDGVALREDVVAEAGAVPCGGARLVDEGVALRGRRCWGGSST